MKELIFIYSDSTTLYEKIENGRPVILFEYISETGVQLIKFLENESQTSPYSLLSGYEKAEELREHFREWVIDLTCEGIHYRDLEGTKVDNPHPIELLKHDERFKKPYTVRHIVQHDKNGNFEIQMGYVITDIWDALYIELIKFIETGKLFKRCGHCKRIFFPKDRAEKYCDRLAEKDKTCKDVGYLYKVENDKLLKAYNNAYKTRHAEKQRKTRGKSQSTVNKYVDAMYKWREDARLGLDNAQNGEISIDEFMEILNKTLEASINGTH